MKQYIAIIILALCMVACGRDSKHREMLMQVESFMEERPDSALIVLKSIDIEDDEYGQMLMHYVQGRLQQEEEDYPASIISMFNAEKTAKKHGASDILGLIYYSCRIHTSLCTTLSSSRIMHSWHTITLYCPVTHAIYILEWKHWLKPIMIIGIMTRVHHSLNKWLLMRKQFPTLK